MKNTIITFELEFTPSQVRQWNELVSRIKDTVITGPKIGFRDYKKPPREFSNKILDLPVIPDQIQQKSEIVQLFESLDQPVWVSPLDVMMTLNRERNKVIK